VIWVFVQRKGPLLGHAVVAGRQPSISTDSSQSRASQVDDPKISQDVDPGSAARVKVA
jgi:hypothetical protein